MLKTFLTKFSQRLKNSATPRVFVFLLICLVAYLAYSQHDRDKQCLNLTPIECLKTIK